MSLTQRWIWEFDVAREPLWRYLSDTDWVNEHARLPRIRARYEALPEGGSRRFGFFRQLGLRVEWEELPTAWIAPESFAVERRYSRGPLRRFFNRLDLQALGPRRTRVTSYLELEAAGPLLEPLLPLLAIHGRRGADRAFALGAKLAARSVRADTLEEGALRSFAGLDEFGIPAAVTAALAAHVAGGEDRELRRMRPYELADSWKLPRRDVLRAFLAATRLGSLNLRWSVICPGCRGPSQPLETLANLQGSYHCPACNVPFDAVFDRSVEVTFDARPLGRGSADDTLYCLASPRRSAHVHAQCVVPARSNRDLTLSLPAGTYDVNAVGIGAVPFVAAVDAPVDALHVRIGDGDGLQAPQEVRSGEIPLRLSNAAAGDVLVRVEDGRWPDTIATAAQVTALAEFRDLFSSEVLAPGLELGIETIAVLFTDVVGSTAMYSRAGDAPAFRIVSDHFEIVRAVVARNDGAVVKTIGDAVMAVFVDPGRCFDAALELDGSVADVPCGEGKLRLRVGFHAGPCIAMRANDRIDYFGTVVNLAARLQSLAEAGQVTMAIEDAQRPGVARRLARSGLRVEEHVLTIKGFDRPVDVIRVDVA